MKGATKGLRTSGEGIINYTITEDYGTDLSNNEMSYYVPFLQLWLLSSQGIIYINGNQVEFFLNILFQASKAYSVLKVKPRYKVW